MGADGLDRTAYEHLLAATETKRERLVVRLAGEAGLRPSEQTRIRPGDVERRRFDGVDHHFLSVRGEDETVCRRTYLPTDLQRLVAEYATRIEADPESRLLAVTPRRIQMLVSEVADRARGADESIGSVSSSDLRQYFARRLLSREEIDPRVVAAIGGWNRLAALEPYTDTRVDDATIAAAFAASPPSRSAKSLSAVDAVTTLELDGDGRIIGTGDDASSLLDRQSLVGDSFAELFAETATEQVRPGELLATAEREGTTEADCWFRTGSGSQTRLTALVCRRRSEGSLDGFTVLLRSASDTAEFGPDAFRRAIDDAGQPICLVDTDGTIEYANSAFESLTGYTVAETVGRPAADLLSPGEGTDEFQSAVRETILDGDTWSGQLTLRRKTGERIHVTQTVAPIVDDGTIQFTVAASTDITKQVRRERALASRCDALETLEALVADINAAGRELIDASTREEIEAAVCESLADSGAYTGVWIGRTDPGDTQVVPSERSGLPATETGRIDTASTPLAAAIDDGDIWVTGGELTGAVVGPFERSAVETARAAAAVPIAYDETTYGVLVAVTDRDTAFGDRERTLLNDLADRIGHAVTAIERHNLLLADTVIELEVSCTDDDAFLVAATREHDCTATLEAVVPVSERSLLFYVTVQGARPDPFLDTATAADGVVDGRYIREYEDRSLLELTAEGNSPALALTEFGAGISGAVAENGTQTVSVTISADSDVRTVVEGLQNQFSGTQLVAKHAVEQPVETVGEFRRSLTDRLTDKQQATLRAAYFSGYFDWPRGSTAEEVAESMGVSSPTLHNHLRKAQRKLLTVFFEHAGHVGGGTDPANAGSVSPTGTD
ncbi:MAG: bacterio-opsin activator domain-containing protein [Natronomonas sp.]